MPDLRYNGNANDAHHDRSVGCAVAKAPHDEPMPALASGGHGSTHAWPVGDALSVRYYEVEVVDQGEHGFIAVGWAREDYPRKYG